MGIKGRRKKLREREEREREALARGEVTQADDAVVVMGEGPYKPPVDAMGRLRMKKSELFKMYDMEYLDRIQEEHNNRRTGHLAVTRNENGQLQRKRRRDDVDDDEVAEEIEREYLGHQYTTEDVERLTGGGGTEASSYSTAMESSPRQKKKRGQFQDEPSQDDVYDAAQREMQLLQTRRERAAKGALYSHPLIGLDSVVVGALEQEGFVRMTRIQERSIPYALEGYDLLGQARTGSGKTLAFCVPILHTTYSVVKRYPHATVALLLSPTKELCAQTHDVLQQLIRHIPDAVAPFRVHLITGGTKIVEERRRLTKGIPLVVGTPGRIHDHVLHCKGWDLTRLKFLVLDEADRMLADGFQRDLDAVVTHVPKSRQTFLFSATNSKSVHELARLSLSRTPILISAQGKAPMPVEMDEAGMGGAMGSSALMAAKLGPYRNYEDPASNENSSEEEEEEEDVEEEKYGSDEDGEGEEMEEDEEGNEDLSEVDEDGEAIPTTLQQFCHIVPAEDRLRSLYVFVKQVARTSKAMIFCSTVASTTFHFQMMGSVGFHDQVMMLHGHMKHRQRMQAFAAFRQWETGVLFCTDVAARGLDIPHVTWILQYDPPLDPTEYIHRIGRTARAGNVGSALLFLTPEEAGFIRYLANFGIHLEKYPMRGDLPRIQEKLEHVLQIDEVVAKSAVTAFRAHVGAYQSHILKETFNVHKLDLDRLSQAFALTAAPHVTLPKNTEEEKKKEYVRGKLKSLNRRRLDALKHYEINKTKTQWEDGHFVGVSRPSMK